MGKHLQTTHGRPNQKTGWTSDLAIAQRNRRRARHDHAMAKRAERLGAHPMWTGNKDNPDWQAYIKRQHASVSTETRRRNLDALVKLDDSGMSRRLGFDSYGRLVIDGDWLCDLDGDEVCMNCAKTLLLAGDFDPSSAWAYLLYVDQPTYTVVCSSCSRELWHVEEEEDEDLELEEEDE